MKKEGIHEGCIEQIQRLYNTRLYSNGAVQLDDKGRIRVDDWEMRSDVQSKVSELWAQATTETLPSIGDLDGYKSDFYNLFGFKVDGVNYTEDVNEIVDIPGLV